MGLQVDFIMTFMTIYTSCYGVPISTFTRPSAYQLMTNPYFVFVVWLSTGKKRFTLFSPSDAAFLYPHGKVSHIHPNGLINYENNGTRADGALEHQIARYRVKKAEQTLASLQVL